MLSLRNLLDDITAWGWKKHRRGDWSSPPTFPSLTSRCRGHWP
ncbi:phage integrase family domain protein [Mycobacterium kansasii 824]|nr:phage integrase family domain protein [Mycobacterium kansasii 824]